MRAKYVRILEAGEEVVVQIDGKTVTITATGKYTVDGVPGVQPSPAIRQLLRDLYKSLRGCPPGARVRVPEDTAWLLLLLP